MKKILLTLGLLATIILGVSTLETQAQSQRILVATTNAPGIARQSAIKFDTNTQAVIFPGALIATNAGAASQFNSATYSNITTFVTNFAPPSSFDTNSIAAHQIQGVTNSAGVADAGKIPKLGASGLLHGSMFSVGGGLLGDVVIISDQKSSGSDGGTATSGAFQTRDVNTENVDTGGNCVISANQFTLQPGTYRCLIRAPAAQCGAHMSRLQNITDATTTTVGSLALTSGGALYANTDSIIMGRFTIGTAKTFEIQHQVQNTRATDGWGAAQGTSFAASVFTQGIFWKE